MANREIRGINFPFRMGANSFPMRANGIDAIISRVRAILTTGQGEIPMRPEQGSIVTKYVFETMTPLMRAYLADEIRTQINTFVPQMKVVSVSTDMVDNRVYVLVGYILEGVEGELRVDFGDANQMP